MTETTSSIGIVDAVRSSSRKGRRSFLKNIPGFAYILVFYIAVAAFVGNPREILFTLGTYSLSWVEVMYLFGTFTAMAEMLRVSKPGIDNTFEALVMLAIGVIFMLIFFAGAMQIPLFNIFARTEFFMLTFISAFQVVMAFIINARTLKRTFDTHGAGDE